MVKRLEDDPEVEAYFPPTDGEMFADILTGEKSRDYSKPIKMRLSTVRGIQNFARTMQIGILIFAVIGSYSSCIEEYCSFSKGYHAQIEQLNKVPSGIYAGQF
ncbi:hypothetical protein HYT25_04985 [Candidatus Pacearchaeota archaeon]|nr:hypothetical protein [Candidatus Pacearchaeota archaeon]